MSRAAATTRSQLWESTAWALDHLGVSTHTLRLAMTATPADWQRPWVDISFGRRPTYNWRTDKIDQWWMELHQWRTSGNGAKTTKSDGPSTERSDRGCARRSRSRANSSGKSSDPKTSESPISLAAYARSLRSPR